MDGCVVADRRSTVTLIDVSELVECLDLDCALADEWFNDSRVMRAAWTIPALNLDNWLTQTEATSLIAFTRLREAGAGSMMAAAVTTTDVLAGGATSIAVTDRDGEKAVDFMSCWNDAAAAFLTCLTTRVEARLCERGSPQ